MKKAKYTVWVYGSEDRGAGLVEQLVLEVGEGFRTLSAAKSWGRAALKRIALARRFKIGPAY